MQSGLRKRRLEKVNGNEGKGPFGGMKGDFLSILTFFHKIGGGRRAGSAEKQIFERDGGTKSTRIKLIDDLSESLRREVTKPH